MAAALLSVRQDSTKLCAATAVPAIVRQVSKASFALVAAPAIVWRDSTILLSMAIADDLHTLFEARRESFEVVDGQPTDANLHRIVEEIAKLLYPIQYDKEGGKHSLIGLIMDKADYSVRFVRPFPRPKRPAICNKYIVNSATGVIHSKSKAIHRACINDSDAYEEA